MENRRKDVRGRTYLGSRAAFNNSASTLDCLVRNLSGHGAKLVFDDEIKALPREFDLIFTQNGQSRHAQIIWRQSREIGVFFGH